MKFAKERGLPLLKHHLVPRTRGFISSIPHLKEKMGAVYDVQLGFKKSVVLDFFASNSHEYESRAPMPLEGKKLEHCHFYFKRVAFVKNPAPK